MDSTPNNNKKIINSSITIKSSIDMVSNSSSSTIVTTSPLSSESSPVSINSSSSSNLSKYDKLCKYRTGKCTHMRALKNNGELHALCELHRSKANRNQRKYDLRKLVESGQTVKRKNRNEKEEVRTNEKKYHNYHDKLSDDDKAILQYQVKAHLKRHNINHPSKINRPNKISSNSFSQLASTVTSDYVHNFKLPNLKSIFASNDSNISVSADASIPLTAGLSTQYQRFPSLKKKETPSLHVKHLKDSVESTYDTYIQPKQKPSISSKNPLLQSSYSNGLEALVAVCTTQPIKSYDRQQVETA